MDKSENTTPERPLEYEQLPWGDLIYGTKEQIRRLGIAVASAFPGDEGYSRRRLTVRDPRGFRCHIEPCSHRADGVFCVSIHFPDRALPEPPFLPFSPGVCKQENIWTDDFVGSSDALAAAGLCRSDQLPGQAGMGKAIVTLLADGSLPTGARKAAPQAARMAGTRKITRASKSTYRVSVFVAEEVRLCRLDAYRQSRDEWEQEMYARPRPAPLQAQVSTAPTVPRFRRVGNVTYLVKA